MKSRKSQKSLKRISILGSTGSIGENALRVIDRLPDQFEVRYLSAGKNAGRLIEQARKYHPKAVSLSDESQYHRVKSELGLSGVEVFCGREGLLQLAGETDVDLVLNSIVGFPGMEPTFRAIEAGVDIALSNKESLVMAGEIIMNLLKDGGVSLFPIDSEHSAIWQCTVGEESESISRIILTGSGGPFRRKPLEEFSSIKPEDALKHPNWVMGKKITIDSATMMNKGLEVIEARWLFNMPPDRINVVVHPESIIHSMVEFIDGSIKAQLGLPDMKLPIQYALNYPERVPVLWEALDFVKIGKLTFEEPDHSRFPAIQLAYDALEQGGTAPAVLNVVNELAVYAFLSERINFTRISELVSEALSTIPIKSDSSLDDILEAEKLGQEFMRRKVG